jgi:N-acetylglucosamine-6-phosphate deacetylase
MREEAILVPFLFDGAKLRPEQAVLVENGHIAAIIPPSEVPGTYPITRPPGAAYLSPGLIDLQVNGGGGVLFNDDITPAGLARIAAAHRALGTSHIQPTLMSGSTAEIAAALDAVRTAMARGVPGILGLHIEGPFFNPRRRGIHPARAIRPMNAEDLDLLTAPFPGPLTLTLAPETVPEAALRRLAAAGVVLLAGHTEATPEEIARARKAGLAGFTHLFNAMPPIAGRVPGPAGAALTDRESFASIIVDGLHVHPEAVRLALAAKATDHLFLVSDAMPTVGAAIDSFFVGESLIRLKEGRLVDEAGTLGGAHLSLAEAVRNVHRLLGLAPAEALRMATATPLACLRTRRGLEDNPPGSLVPGGRADLALFDRSLALLGSWEGGIFRPGPEREPPSVGKS